MIFDKGPGRRAVEREANEQVKQALANRLESERIDKYERIIEQQMRPLDEQDFQQMLNDFFGKEDMDTPPQTPYPQPAQQAYYNPPSEIDHAAGGMIDRWGVSATLRALAKKFRGMTSTPASLFRGHATILENAADTILEHIENHNRREQEIEEGTVLDIKTTVLTVGAPAADYNDYILVNDYGVIVDSVRATTALRAQHFFDSRYPDRCHDKLRVWLLTGGER